MIPVVQDAEKVGSPPAAGAAHGIPDDRAASLPALLAEARRLRLLGRSPADVRRAVLARNRALLKPLPAYSPGGLAECLDAVLAELVEGPGGGA